MGRGHFGYGRVSLLCFVPHGGHFYFILLQIKNERIQKIMKKTIKSIVSIALLLIMLLTLVACQKGVDVKGLWEKATYTKDTTFGNGKTTVMVEVKVEDQSVTFTIKTDKTTLGEALMEHDLIAGDQGQFGIYIKSVNGITADYDVDQSYWAFYINGEYAMTGVDTTQITEGDTYQLAYAKG